MEQVSENLWVLRYPLRVLGAQLGRTVTVIRLASGELVIHSTAPFTSSDAGSIRALGRPAWLLDATLFHDTFAAAGCAAFPETRFAAPAGFSFATEQGFSLGTPPSEWRNQVEVLALEGIPRLREHVFFHRPTRTLIVADLVFNFGPEHSAWTHWFFRWGGDIREFPGMSRLFRTCIKDRTAFASSLQRMMQWDFERLIVGHGDIIGIGAKAKLASALARHSF